MLATCAKVHMLELLSTACTLAEQRSPLAQICVCLSFRSHIHTLMSKRICGCPSLKPCEFRVTWAQIPIDWCKLSIRAEAMGKVRNAMKKPASSRARAPRATLPEMMTSQCVDVLAAWIAGELGSLPETNLPDWCEHALAQVDGYMRSVAAKHEGGKLWINVWSDCVCMGTEMEAGAILGKKLKDRYDLDCELAMFFACDTDGKCMDYVKRNYSPTHTAADVFKRNWTDGNLVLSTGDLLEFLGQGRSICTWPDSHVGHGRCEATGWVLIPKRGTCALLCPRQSMSCSQPSTLWKTSYKWGLSALRSPMQ